MGNLEKRLEKKIELEKEDDKKIMKKKDYDTHDIPYLNTFHGNGAGFDGNWKW